MSLGQGNISILIEAVNRTREGVQGAEADLERLRKARIESQKLTLEEARAVSYLRREYRAQHMAYYDAISVMRNVGSIGRSILTMWQAHNIAQLRVQESLKGVAEAQIWYNTALEIYGENSVVTLAALSELEDAQIRAKKAASDAEAGILGMGLTAIGVAGQVGALVLKLKELQMLTAAGAITLPVVVAVGLKWVYENLPEEYQAKANPNAPPGPANANWGINLGAVIGDLLGSSGATGQGFGGGGTGVGHVEVTQINYGVKSAEDAIDQLRQKIEEIVYR